MNFWASTSRTETPVILTFVGGSNRSEFHQPQFPKHEFGCARVVRFFVKESAESWMLLPFAVC